MGIVDVARSASSESQNSQNPASDWIATASAAACRTGERGRLLATGKWRTQSCSGSVAISAQVPAQRGQARSR